MGGNLIRCYSRPATLGNAFVGLPAPFRDGAAGRESNDAVPWSPAKYMPQGNKQE